MVPFLLIMALYSLTCSWAELLWNRNKVFILLVLVWTQTGNGMSHLCWQHAAIHWNIHVGCGCWLGHRLWRWCRLRHGLHSWLSRSRTSGLLCPGLWITYSFPNFCAWCKDCDVQNYHYPPEKLISTIKMNRLNFVAISIRVITP